MGYFVVLEQPPTPPGNTAADIRVTAHPVETDTILVGPTTLEDAQQALLGIVGADRPHRWRRATTRV